MTSQLLSAHAATQMDRQQAATTDRLPRLRRWRRRARNGGRPPSPQTNRSEIEQLATNAGCRHDAHIVKYALAVIDASLADPPASGLDLQAGERLLEIWDDNGGDPADSLEP